MAGVIFVVCGRDAFLLCTNNVLNTPDLRLNSHLSTEFCLTMCQCNLRIILTWNVDKKWFRKKADQAVAQIPTTLWSLAIVIQAKKQWEISIRVAAASISHRDGSPAGVLSAMTAQKYHSGKSFHLWSGFIWCYDTFAASALTIWI